MKKLLLLVVGFNALSALAQYSIDWFKIAGSGGLSTGGTFTVVGVIGQPEAGQLRGGTFSVTGGVLALPIAVLTPGAPTLVIVPGASPGTAMISWIPTTAKFVLQETRDSSLANWVDSASGATNPVTISTVRAAKFYRLSKP